jgi:hypothetical protein
MEAVEEWNECILILILIGPKKWDKNGEQQK